MTLAFEMLHSRLADGPIRHFLMGMSLAMTIQFQRCRLCRIPKRWSVAEMSRDGEFLALSGNSDSRWNAWLGFLAGCDRKDSWPIGWHPLICSLSTMQVTMHAKSNVRHNNPVNVRTGNVLIASGCDSRMGKR